VAKIAATADGGSGSDCYATAGTLRFYKYATPNANIGKKMNSLNTPFVEQIRTIRQKRCSGALKSAANPLQSDHIAVFAGFRQYDMENCMGYRKKCCFYR